MNIIFWNIRGISNNDSRLTFSDMCRLHHPSLVFIAEPMVSYDSIPSWFWRNVHVNNYCLNCCAGGLATMGHDITDTTWFNTLPSSLLADFARDRHGLPNDRFP